MHTIPLHQLESKRCFGHCTSVTAVAWNKDGDKLLAGGDSSHVLIYDSARLETSTHPEHKFLCECRGHTKTITSVIASPTAPDIFATAGLDQLLCIFDTRVQTRPIHTLQFKSRCLHAVWSPDGNTIAVSHDDYHVSFVDCLAWNVRSNHTLALDSDVRKFAWAPDGDSLLFPTATGSVKVYSWPKLSHTQTIRGNTSAVTSVACDTKYPHYFAVASMDCMLSMWESQFMNIFTIDRWEDPLTQAMFSKDGLNLLAVIGEFDHIDIIDGLTGTYVHSVQTHCRVNDICWHPNRTLLAYAPTKSGRDRYSAQETVPPVCVWGYVRNK